MICSRVPSRLTSKPEDWWIEKATPGPCSTSTARGKPPANVPYHRERPCPRPFADWMTCVLLATPDANVERLSGHAQRSRRRIIISGSAVLAIEGTGAIVRNYARGLRLLSVPGDPPDLTGTHTAQARWAIWQWGCARRSRWVRVCDPRQGLWPARSPTRSGASALST